MSYHHFPPSSPSKVIDNSDDEDACERTGRYNVRLKIWTGEIFEEQRVMLEDTNA